MSNCNNCFNGCTEITSDKCVKYTGINIPTLGIETGDTLAFVEQKLIEFLLTTLDGTGVIIDLTGINVCALVQGYLPSSGNISIEDIAKALIRSSCDLQTQLNLVKADITTLNANYTIGCLSGVTTTSDTHDIVQATINKVCEINTSLTALALELRNQYVPISPSVGHPGINDYIAAYLAVNNPASNKYYTRMVPYTVVELYPTNAILAKFNNGVGQDEWEKIYFCNGSNPGVPDKRGVVGVGVTTGMGGATLPAETIPNTFNPNYVLNQIPQLARNSHTLTLPQIPSHNHTGSTAVDAGHTHTLPSNVLLRQTTGGANLQTGSGVLVNDSGSTSVSSKANINLTIIPEGGNQAHSNVQVGLGCYYIMYVP